MSSLAGWLADGDLRSDGFADQAARLILENPGLTPDLFSALDDGDPVVRAHAADALEKIGRTRPDLLKPGCGQLIALAGRPEPGAVRMHLAMIFGHLALYPELRRELLDALLDLLEAPGAFSRAWAISSLCILGRVEASFAGILLDRLSRMANDPSIAIRTRVRKAIPLLSDGSTTFPKGWVKSDFIQELVSKPPGAVDNPGA